MAKVARGVIGSACVNFFRTQYRNQTDVDKEELWALEIDETGKVLLASWCSTRFDDVQILREVLAPPLSSLLSSHG